MKDSKLWINSKNAKIANAYQAVIDSMANEDFEDAKAEFNNYIDLIESIEQKENMTVTEKIDKFVAENGGNERDALNVALARLEACEKNKQFWKAEAEKVDKILFP